MKKIITLLSAAFIAVASLATVASAAPITEDTFKPTIAADITKVSKAGKATITFTVDVDKELDLIFDEDYETWSGFGVRMWQVNLSLNSDMFVDASVNSGKNYDALENVLVSEDGVVTLGTATKTLELTENYKTMSAEELNALNFAEVTYAELGISSWEEAESFGEQATATAYRSDDKGNFVIDLAATRIGTYVDTPEPPAPTASVKIEAAKKTTDANWIAENGNTMFWGVKFENGGFNGSAVAKFFSDAKERELNIVQDGDINGDATFGVFVIVGDSTDAIGLTITSGDVTATAAPVAYADAE